MESFSGGNVAGGGGLAQLKSSRIGGVIAALGDVIKSQQEPSKLHEPTPTEYFAIILSTISSGKHDESLAELLKILEAVIPRASLAIVRGQFRLLATCLLQLAKVNSSDQKILSLSLSALGAAMKVQETSDGFWGAVYALQSINAFLSCLDDARFKIRKVSTTQLVAVLNVHRMAGSRSVRSYIGDFCQQVLRACTRNEYKRSLFIVLFLESALPHLADNSVCAIYETALKLQACEQPILTAAVFRMVDSLFQSPSLSLNTTQCAEALQLLIQMKPRSADMEANTYFCTALASVVLCLHKKDVNAAHGVLPDVITALVSGCEAEFTQIHCAVGTALKRVISTCLEDNLIKQATAQIKGQSSSSSSSSSGSGSGSSSLSSSFSGFVIGNPAETVRQVVASVELLLQLKYQHAWLYVMDAIRSLFDRFRGESGKLLLGTVVVKLADLYQATITTALQVEVGVQVALSDALGGVLRSLGVVHFLELVPLRESTSPLHVGVDISREWVLSVLHSNLKLMHCALADFGVSILPAASGCSKAVNNPQKFSLNDSAVQIIRTRLLQLWSLFPELCFLGVTDIPQSFPKIAAILDAAMKDDKYPELLPHIVVGLTHIARVARERCPVMNPASPPADTPELAAVRAQAQVFLPAVLSFLDGTTVGDSKFQNGVQFVAAWAAVSPPAMITAVCKRLLQLLLSSTTASSDGSDSDTASVWMAVVQVMIPHMPEAMVSLLYRTVRPLLSVDESISLQKRAYAVLATLLKSHGDIIGKIESRLQILSVVSDSLLTCNVSARSMRLRCMETLMEGMDDGDFQAATKSIFGEVLICQKDANKKSRDGAIVLLDMIIKRVPAQDMLMQLCAGIAGETSVMRSAAVIGLCLLFHQKREPALLQFAANVLPTVCLLLREECPEMSRSVLSFVKVCCAILPVSGLLESSLPQIVFAFTEGLGPHKSKFSSRARGIMRKLSQRVDVEQLRGLLPEADLPLLGYIQKQARRAQRKKTARDAESKSHIDKFLGSDSDDSEDDDDKASVKMHTHQAEDPRLARRPKAVKAVDVRESFPTSLDDLLEDQPASFAQGGGVKAKTAREGRGAGKISKEGVASLRPDDEDEDYTVAVTVDGRVVVKQRDDDLGSNAAVDYEKGGGAGGRKAARAEAEAAAPAAPPAKRPRAREPGEEYRSKKAGGDVWKRGMLEPHAFIPLDPRLLNKKKQKEAVAHFGTVVKAGRQARLGGVGSAARKGRGGNRNQRKTMREHSFDKKK